MAKVMQLNLNADYRLDHGTHSDIVARLNAAFEDGMSHVCLNAVEVTRYEDSCYWSMLALALMTWRKKRGLSIKLGLCVPHDRIEGIALTRLDSAVSLFTSTEEAMQDLDWKVREAETASMCVDRPKVTTPHVCHACQRPL